MKIIGVAKPKPNGTQVLICELVEAEADKITGSAGKTHQPHRYKAGTVINLSPVYNRQKKISDKIEQLKAALAKSQVDTSELETVLLELEEP